MDGRELWVKGIKNSFILSNRSRSSEANGGVGRIVYCIEIDSYSTLQVDSNKEARPHKPKEKGYSRDLKTRIFKFSLDQSKHPLLYEFSQSAHLESKTLLNLKTTKAGCHDALTRSDMFLRLDRKMFTKCLQKRRKLEVKINLMLLCYLIKSEQADSARLYLIQCTQNQILKNRTTHSRVKPNKKESK